MAPERETPLSRPLAFRKALTEFYAHQAAQENRERIAQELLWKAEDEAEAAEAAAAAERKAAEYMEGALALEEETSLEASAGLLAEKPKLEGFEYENRRKPHTLGFVKWEEDEVAKGAEHLAKIQLAYVSHISLCLFVQLLTKFPSCTCQSP